MKEWIKWLLVVFAGIGLGGIMFFSTDYALTEHQLLSDIMSQNEYEYVEEVDEGFEELFGENFRGEGSFVINMEGEYIVLAMEGEDLIAVNLMSNENGEFVIYEAFYVDGEEVYQLLFSTEVYVAGELGLPSFEQLENELFGDME